MAYVLEAVIGPVAVLSVVTRGHPEMAVVALRQGLGLLPVTGEMRGAVNDGTPATLPGFEKLPGGLETLLCSWSARGPLAYVEAEFFGGPGTQAAAVWDGGKLVLGPVLLGEKERFPAAGSPISQALARLGVTRGEHYDEFDAAGLGQQRHTEDWLPRAEYGQHP